MTEAGSANDPTAARLAVLMENVNAGVALIDEAGRFSLFNQRFLEMFGLEPDSDVRNVNDRDWSAWSVCDEGGRLLEVDEHPVRRAVLTGRPVRDQLVGVRNPGSADVVWMLVSAAPLFDQAGHLENVICTYSDVTEHKRQQERLEKLSRLYAVLSRVNEQVVRTRVPADLYWHVCRILAEDGRHPLVWVGMVQGTLVLPVAWAGPGASYLEGIRVEVLGELGAGPTGTCVREGRPVVNDDFDSNAATLPWREVARAHGLRSSAAFPLRREGSVVGSLTLYASEPGTFDPEQVALLGALSADVSYALDAMSRHNALRESEQSLREMDQRKNEFLAMLSHELRNPLAPIRNSLYVIDRAAPGSEQARRAHAVIERQIAHVTRLVDDLLDLTRITRGKIQLHREVLDLNSLAVRTVEDHRTVCVTSGVALEVEPAPGPLWVNGDHTRLSQIIGNLLQNSAKFTPRGGRISVSIGTDASRRRAIVRVQDSGVGIAPEILPRLFEPFTQADSTLDRSQGGLGLGLSLVRGLVELHGGSVHAASEGANRGATFTIELPLEAEVGDDARDAAPAAGAGGQRRVLVIEDNVDAADTLRDALSLTGHLVEVAYSGAAGIEKAAAFRPDVVFCDIGLPGIDGYGVARALRGQAQHRGLALVALTGYAQSEEVARCLAAGFDAHLAKPASIETIERVLAETQFRGGA